VRQLLEAKTDPRKAASGDREHLVYAGCTPLYNAAQNGQAHVVKLLLEAEANVGARLVLVSDGTTPLYVAAQNGHEEVVKVLIGNGAHVEKGRTDIGSTPLFVAAEHGHVKVVQALIDVGADRQAKRFDSGSTALIRAAALVAGGSRPTVWGPIFTCITGKAALKL
jgi:ankyrin repeat protein